ncbi:MAG: hypothetical protein H0W62_13100 [Chitinophagales bacterium]|nr:hypothetical protein [Chitinophagales bacterium]
MKPFSFCYLIILLAGCKCAFAQKAEKTYWHITMKDGRQLTAEQMQELMVDSVLFLTQKSDNKSGYWIPVDSIRELEKVRKFRRAGRGIWIGALIGGVAGTVIGDRSGHAPASGFVFFSEGAGAGLGLLFGAITGAVIGVATVADSHKPKHFDLENLSAREKRKLIDSHCREYNCDQ